LCQVSGSGPGFLVFLRGTVLRCHAKLQEVERFSCKLLRRSWRTEKLS